MSLLAYSQAIIITVHIEHEIHPPHYAIMYLLLGSAEWDRMVEEVKCIDAQPGGVASSNESADISSFTDDSSIESCHSPEIQRRNDIIVDCEDSSDGIEPRPLAHDSESESDMSLFLSRARRTEGQKVDSPVGMGFLDPQTSTPLSETKASQVSVLYNL